MSLAARLLNVFAIPGEVFEVVKASRVSTANWLLPMLLSAVVLAFSAVVAVSQPAVQKQMHEPFERWVKMLQQEVKDGKLKQADVDRVVAVGQAITPHVLRVLFGGGAALFGVARVFWWTLALWLLGRGFLKVRLNFFKTLEVAGLAMMIGVLDGAVTLLLMLNLPDFVAARGLAQAVNDLESLQKSPLSLAVSTVFALWFLGVLSVGLGRLARVPLLRAAWFVFAFWLLQESLLILLAGGLAQFAR